MEEVAPNEKSRVFATEASTGVDADDTSGDLKVKPEVEVCLAVSTTVVESVLGASLAPKEKLRDGCGAKIVEVVVVIAFDAVVTATPNVCGTSGALKVKPEVGMSLVSLSATTVATELLEATSEAPPENKNDFTYFFYKTQ